MNRREFLDWVSVGALASFLPVAVAACHSNPKPPKSAAIPEADGSLTEDGYQSLATIPELKARGQVVNQNAIQPVLIFSHSGNTIGAINPTCSHQGCTVEWQLNNGIFVCPCHGSKFDRSGKVIEGPATEPLDTFATRTEGNLILVKISP